MLLTPWCGATRYTIQMGIQIMFVDNVDHWAHFGGYAAGLVCYFVLGPSPNPKRASSIGAASTVGGAGGTVGILSVSPRQISVADPCASVLPLSQRENPYYG